MTETRNSRLALPPRPTIYQALPDTKLSNQEDAVDLLRRQGPSITKEYSGHPHPRYAATISEILFNLDIALFLQHKFEGLTPPHALARVVADGAYTYATQLTSGWDANPLTIDGFNNYRNEKSKEKRDPAIVLLRDYEQRQKRLAAEERKRIASLTEQERAARTYKNGRLGLDGNFLEENAQVLDHDSIASFMSFPAFQVMSLIWRANPFYTSLNPYKATFEREFNGRYTGRAPERLMRVFQVDALYELLRNNRLDTSSYDYRLFALGMGYRMQMIVLSGMYNWLERVNKQSLNYSIYASSQGHTGIINTQRVILDRLFLGDEKARITDPSHRGLSFLAGQVDTLENFLAFMRKNDGELELILKSISYMKSPFRLSTNPDPNGDEGIELLNRLKEQGTGAALDHLVHILKSRRGLIPTFLRPDIEELIDDSKPTKAVRHFEPVENLENQIESLETRSDEIVEQLHQAIEEIGDYVSRDIDLEQIGIPEYVDFVRDLPLQTQPFILFFQLNRVFGKALEDKSLIDEDRDEVLRIYNQVKETLLELYNDISELHETTDYTVGIDLPLEEKVEPASLFNNGQKWANILNYFILGCAALTVDNFHTVSASQFFAKYSPSIFSLRVFQENFRTLPNIEGMRVKILANADNTPPTDLDTVVPDQGTVVQLIIESSRVNIAREVEVLPVARVNTSIYSRNKTLKSGQISPTTYITSKVDAEDEEAIKEYARNKK